MGAYKSRPPSSCSEAWLKRVSDSYSSLRTRISLDTSINKETELSALQQACCDDDIDEVLQLMDDTNIYEKTESGGHSLLHLCCMDGGCRSAVRLLARVGTRINSLSGRGFAPLHIACFKGDIELVSDLLIGGADVKQISYASITALHLASLEGHAQVVELLLRYEADLCTQDVLMFTPLHAACFFGHDQVVKCLINHNADINVGGGVGLRPLHLSCTQGFLTVTELLVTGRKNNKADVNIQDNENNTPLHYCARKGHLPILNYLLDPSHGVKGHKVNIYGDTALHVACYHGKIEVTKQLLPKLTPECFTIENIFSEAPLHCACTSGQSMDLVKFLTEQNGVDINYQGRDGHTALHSACYHGRLQLVQFLIEQGANLDLVCNDDVMASKAKKQTCLVWASERGHDDVVVLLKKAAQDRPALST
ncbi:serine/threonine-protein kinase TNNI3K-like [Asterias amurensis]|uniref:serine/threonine-protein kinase TNNI3K-like n=1 Tax=Asterias amurensis TaxID=7602 RepID=UPI003AB6CD32